LWCAQLISIVMCAIDFNCDVRNSIQLWCAQLISIVMCGIDFNCDVRNWFQLWCAQLISIVMCAIQFNCDVRNWFQSWCAQLKLWCAQLISIVMCAIQFNRDVRNLIQLWCTQLISIAQFNSIVMCVIQFRHWIELRCVQFKSIVMCAIQFNNQVRTMLRILVEVTRMTNCKLSQIAVRTISERATKKPKLRGTCSWKWSRNYFGLCHLLTILLAFLGENLDNSKLNTGKLNLRCWGWILWKCPKRTPNKEQVTSAKNENGCVICPVLRIHWSCCRI